MTTKTKPAKKTVEENKVYDFTNAQQVKAFFESEEEYICIDEYIQTGKFNVVYGNKKIFRIAEEEYAIAVVIGNNIITLSHRFSNM